MRAPFFKYAVIPVCPESVIAEPVGRAGNSLPARDLALDIGTGTGRDAAWLTSQGFDAIAVEPSTEMRREAQTRHRALVFAGLTTVCPHCPPRFASCGLASDQTATQV